MMCLSFVLSQLLRAEGLATYSMIGLAAGSICNIILDPILISGVGMGIAGASTATLVSQILSAIILLSAYVFRKSHLQPFSHLGIKSFLLFGKIFVTGLPSLFRQGLSGLATILINHAAKEYSSAAVLALSLVARVFLLVFSLCLGIGQGMMPVVGYSHGAGNEKRQKDSYRFAVRLSTAAMFAISIPLIIWAPEVISLFRDDSEVIQIGAFALRAQCAILFTHGLVTCTILYLQAIGRAFLGAVLAAARQGIFFLPLVFLLPAKFGLLGLCLAQPAADAVTFLFAWIIKKTRIKKESRQQKLPA
jgi:Na+-driven multidrug efflux pump